jgi:hypothetical protein
MRRLFVHPHSKSLWTKGLPFPEFLSEIKNVPVVFELVTRLTKLHICHSQHALVTDPPPMAASGLVHALWLVGNLSLVLAEETCLSSASNFSHLS